MPESKPKLFYSTNKENEAVFQKLQEARIVVHFYGPLSGEKKPELIFNSRRFYGEDQIQIFINGWQRGEIKENLIPTG